MSDLVVIAFPSEAKAEEVRQKLLAMQKDYLIELGDADAVVAAGTDAMTASMLAMIGRFSDVPTDHVRPFDGEQMWGITWPVEIRGVPTWLHAIPRERKRLGKRRGH